MNFKNDGLTVGELSIAIVTLIIIGFIWTNLTKDKENQEITMLSYSHTEINDVEKMSIYKIY